MYILSFKVLEAREEKNQICPDLVISDDFGLRYKAAVDNSKSVIPNNGGGGGDSKERGGDGEDPSVSVQAITTLNPTTELLSRAEIVQVMYVVVVLSMLCMKRGESVCSVAFQYKHL